MVDREEAEASTSHGSTSQSVQATNYLSSLLAGDDMDTVPYDAMESLVDDALADDDQDDDDQGSDYMEDDELTGMMQQGKELREKLRTGDMEEISRHLDQDMAEFEDNLIATTGIGKMKHKKRRQVMKGEARLPEPIKQLLGQANNLYIQRDYGAAIAILQEVLTKHPNASQAWNTLGMIHDEMGNTSKALEVRMVAAHMVKDDADLWKELGLKSIENQAYRQALYCFDKALTIEPLDIDTLWDRAFLQKNMGQVDQAISGFQQLLELMPFHFKVVNELTQLYRTRGQTRQAIQLYTEAVEYHIKNDKPGQADDDDAMNPFSDRLGYSEINMLSELYLMLNEFRHALDCIKSGIRHVQRRQHETYWLDRLADDDDEYLVLNPRRAAYVASLADAQNNKNRQDDDDEADDPSYEPDNGDNGAHGKSKETRRTRRSRSSRATTPNEEKDTGVYDQDTSGMSEEEERVARARIDIPMELRVRMGICRIYLGNLAIADRHFQHLYAVSPADYMELYQDVAVAYKDRRHFEEALVVFQRIIHANDEIEIDLLIRTADCYREVGQLETAQIFYVNVLDEQPDNLDVMMALAMVYEEMGREDEARELADHVRDRIRENRKQRRAELKSMTRPTDIALAEQQDQIDQQRTDRLMRLGGRTQGSLFDEHNRQGRTQQRERRREQKRREEEERQINALHAYDKLLDIDATLPPCLIDADRNTMRHYILVAQTLWDDFRTTRAMFASDKRIMHDGSGFYAARTRELKRTNYRDARSMSERLRKRKAMRSSGAPAAADDIDNDTEEELEQEEQEEIETQAKTLVAKKHFRNIPFAGWVDLFIKLCFFLTMMNRGEEALNILRTVNLSRMAEDDPGIKVTLRVTSLGCSKLQKDYKASLESCRWFLSVFQYEPTSYRMYCAAFTSGLQDVVAFSTSDTLKTLIRSIKLMDLLHTRYLRQQRGDAPRSDADAQEVLELQQLQRAMRDNDDDDDDNAGSHGLQRGDRSIHAEQPVIGDLPPMPHLSSHLLTLYGHFLMLSNNFLPALVFYMRSFAVNPDDPLNTLCIAIANLMRGMQRRTDNRHLQVIKAMEFLGHYARLRNHNQEAEYNMGRAFHAIGLSHLAVRHYERALVLPSAANEGKVAPKAMEHIYTYPSPDMDVDNDEMDYDPTDLSREAAYNLHLIYMTSGAPAMAQLLLMKYCTI
ncbi:hypothetical protein BC940DRAFT_275295 [Gongronella butleri]|nr:hypothetical protein BC940DRAFT_275295 [Gongronella butleri]